MYVQGYMHVMYEVHGFFLWRGGALLGISGFLPLPPFSPIYLCFVCICGLGGGKGKQPHGG